MFTRHKGQLIEFEYKYDSSDLLIKGDKNQIDKFHDIHFLKFHNNTLISITSEVTSV